jgi:outer membrane protein OmpA-like peptidoglycan-associated protein
LSGEAPRNIGAGSYTVTVTDNKGKFRTATVDVLDARLKLKVRQKKPASAPGIADGSAEVDIATNASGIAILWDNGEVMVTATKLTPGEHKVAVTDPKGCAMTLTVMIAVVGQPLVLTLTPEINIMCAGGKVPLLAKVEGGKPPYAFSWNNASLSGDKVNVSAGKYALTVTDATGATATAVYNLTQPEPLTVTAMAQGVSSAGGADGKALVQAKGGSGTYSFKWDNGETSFSATKLPAGNHTVIVSDAHGCVANAYVKIDAKIDGFAVILREARPIKCYGEKTNLSVAAVGGKTPYKEFQWSPNMKSATQSIGAGEYAVTATDAAGTTATATISILAPQELLASAIPQSATNAGEDNGKALVTIKGGTGAMSFNWDNGEITAATNHLSAGLHRVTVTDENGCTATATVTITEGVLPLTMVVNEVKAIQCAGEKASLEVQVIGGKGPFNYAWSNPAIVGGRPNVPAGEYSVTMTDMAGTKAVATISVKQPAAMAIINTVCTPATIGASDGKAKVIFEGGALPRTFSWDNGETTEEAIRLPAGTHQVTATDANGCSVTATAEVAENVRSLTVAITEKISIQCTGQKAGLVLKVTGGKAPFQYSWSNPNLSGDTPGGLDAGSYSVTVTDAKGNTQSASITVKAPSVFVVELTRNIGATAGKNDGKAEISIKGGTPKYSILWDTKQTGLSAPKLAFGKHSVNVTDANGCIQKIDFETEKRILPELTGTLESGQTIRMRLLNFDTDSSALKSDALPMLDELYDFMTEHAAIVIEVAGHTNNQPSDAFADQLSTARAKAVAEYLFAKGVDPKRVQYKGYGKRLPLVPNTSPEGRRTNQRVEIKILRVKQ